MMEPHRTYFIIMNTNEFVKYVTPEVEIIEVEVEKGFAISGDGFGDTNNPNTGE